MSKSWNVKFSRYNPEVKRDVAKPTKEIWTEFTQIAKDEYRTDTKRWFDKVGYLNAIELFQRRVNSEVTRIDNQVLKLSRFIEDIERIRKAIGVKTDDRDLERDKVQLNWLVSQRKPAMEKLNEHLLTLMVELATSQPKSKAKSTTRKTTSTGKAKATRSKTKEVKSVKPVNTTTTSAYDGPELPF